MRILKTDTLDRFPIKYRFAYLVAIATTLLLVLSTQLFIQRSLKEKSADAQLINVAGRQRMLSQRLLHQVYQCHLMVNPVCNQGGISADLQEWSDANRFIAYHPNVVKEADNSSKLRMMLAELQEKIGVAERMINTAAIMDTDQLSLFRENQMTFLETMDDAVFFFEQASQDKLARLSRIEMFLALLTLLVLSLEVLLIFRPIIRRLVSQNRMLQKSQHLVKQYAYAASADLRNPIRQVVNSILELRPSLGRKKLSAQEVSALESIETNALKAQSISRDLITYTEVMTKDPEVSVVDFWELINSLVQQMEEHIFQVNATVNIGNLPRKIKVDPKLFALLWQHLLQNALQYRRPDVLPFITISGESDEEAWYFSITDNGHGITPAEQVYLFELFRRIQNPDNQQGTGLGLPLAKQIVEQHGGTISIDSRVDQGTTVNVTIPRKPATTKLRSISNEGVKTIDLPEAKAK